MRLAEAYNRARSLADVLTYSVKAIETPQQVHFLLDFVSYLQSQAKVVVAGNII